MSFLTGKIAAYVTGGLLIVIVGLGLALAITRGTLHKRSDELSAMTAQRDTLQRWQDTVRQTTSTAAHISKDGKPAILAVDQVPVQIVYLGNAADQLKRAIAGQSASIDAAAADGRARVDQGLRNLAQVEADQPRADTASRDLRDSAAHHPTEKQCADSPAFAKHSGDL